MPNTAELAAEFKADIERLDRMAANHLTMNEVEFVYHQLRQLVPESGMKAESITVEFILQNEALTTALVVAYGRLFASGNGTTKLDAKKLPEAFREAHEEIISLRNERYAHHGAHHSLTTTVALESEGDDVIFGQSISVGMWFGAPIHWGPLFVWLRGHIHDRVQSELAYLSQRSGVTWKMRNGPPPSWV